MIAIVGLGNPGSQYEKTRHNIGFLAADTICSYFGFRFSGQKFKSQFFEGSIESVPVKLIKPNTYMNLSGEAVKALISFYKIPLDQVWVIYDDIDLEFGKLRIRKEGTAGTHNGMKSIVQELGSTQFPRLRMGIGPKPPAWNLSDFVLANFTKNELECVENWRQNIPKVFHHLVQKGVGDVMNYLKGYEIILS